MPLTRIGPATPSGTCAAPTRFSMFDRASSGSKPRQRPHPACVRCCAPATCAASMGSSPASEAWSSCIVSRLKVRLPAARPSRAFSGSSWGGLVAPLRALQERACGSRRVDRSARRLRTIFGGETPGLARPLPEPPVSTESDAGSSLMSELRSARRLEFHLDSGVGHGCSD